MSVLAGEGIRGPPGLVGPAGPKGPPGSAGRPSNERGIPGKPGGQGSIGATGKFGGFGERGSLGPPGEPGLPAPYCPSDCGVNTIIAPMSAPAPIEVPFFVNLSYKYVQSDQNDNYAPASAVTEETMQESFDETSYKSFFGA